MINKPKLVKKWLEAVFVFGASYFVMSILLDWIFNHPVDYEELIDGTVFLSLTVPLFYIYRIYKKGELDK